MHMYHVVDRSVHDSTLAYVNVLCWSILPQWRFVTNVPSAIVDDCVSLSPSVWVQVDICNKISGLTHICLSLYIGHVYTYTHTYGICTY